MTKYGKIRRKFSRAESPLIPSHRSSVDRLGSFSENSNDHLPTSHHPTTRPIPRYFDLTMEGEQLRALETERVNLHDRKRELLMTNHQQMTNHYELTRHTAEFNIYLGNKEKAIWLLMETPKEHPNFFKSSSQCYCKSRNVSEYSESGCYRYDGK